MAFESLLLACALQFALKSAASGYDLLCTICMETVHKPKIGVCFSAHIVGSCGWCFAMKSAAVSGYVT